MMHHRQTTVFVYFELTADRSQFINLFAVVIIYCFIVLRYLLL